jgi:hypothetical protein
MASQITMLHLLATHAPEGFSVPLKTKGLDGFSVNEKWNGFTNPIGVKITKQDVDPKYVISGWGCGGMVQHFDNEKEWLLAFPNYKMPINTYAGGSTKVTIGGAAAKSVRDKIFWDALEQIKKLGWTCEVKGKEITLTPPWMSSPDAWKEILDPDKARTVAAASDATGMCSCGHSVAHHTHPPDFGCDEKNCGCEGYDDSDSSTEEEEAAADRLSPGSVMRQSIRSRALGIESKAWKLAGYTEFQGLPISVETKKGAVRTGKNADGTEWSVIMPCDYGYIKGTKGMDGQGVDCFIGPVKDAKFAYIVHQSKFDGSGFDEDKVMLGFSSADKAKKVYQSAYEKGVDLFQSMSVLPMHEFARKVLATKDRKRPGKIHAEGL